ncbi:MAG: SUMF1/EgtB/PvdO family nonheme iron enzyme [Chromatiales bacterium]|nr:SUMF1/EgtB/PvdO family nonheme iron enzyme [Gammaproteobacteria bacterium]MCP5352647.1 SUMF1/EgtB/PvdO family nonheme iron enzyme [Chromatiales bacterium]
MTRTLLPRLFLSALALSLAAPVLAEDTGTIKILTEPGDAKVFINGQRKGNSPLEAGQTFAIKLAEGEYLLEALKAVDEYTERYGRKEIFVAADTLQTITLKLDSRDTPAGVAKKDQEKAEREARLAREKAENERIGKELQAKGLVPETVAIPAGSFRMGCVSGKDCSSYEKPVHTVNVPAFEMTRTEITFEQWDACVALGGCRHNPDDKGWGRGDRPVINVSWDDVQDYIRWLNALTGGGWRLPSEAEWEYAARAGTSTRFHTGDCLTTEQANYDGHGLVKGCPKGEYREKTLPVGSLAKNAFGLYDMHGNVWEWTRDCWNDSYSGAPTNGAAWNSGDCSQRVLRGGSWSDGASGARAAIRGGLTRDYRGSFLGFRLAQD